MVLIPSLSSSSFSLYSGPRLSFQYKKVLVLECTNQWSNNRIYSLLLVGASKAMHHCCLSFQTDIHLSFAFRMLCIIYLKNAEPQLQGI